jgi:hypothetical protein
MDTTILPIYCLFLSMVEVFVDRQGEFSDKIHA